MLTAMASTDDRPAFARAGRDWPNREASRFVTAGGLTWHVQEAGEGPVLLLVHGTGQRPIPGAGSCRCSPATSG